MTDHDLMQQALFIIAHLRREHTDDEAYAIEEAFRARLAQPEPEPVAWLITDKMLNSLQIDSIQRLIDRARHAHMTDIKLRINGQDEWYQADWLKHMKRTTLSQREWQGLHEREECARLAALWQNFDLAAAIRARGQE